MFTSSGSSANLVLIQALKNLSILKNGDAVGVSALTWSTNIMPLIQLGLQPVLIDCEIKTLNISPQTLKPHLKKIQALFSTNVLGFCDQINEIRQLCQKHHILFLEDNCESMGSKAFGRLLGNFGLASTFSFFVGHHLSTIEGGMICTDDKNLYEMLLLVRAHGWDRNLPKTTQERLRRQNRIDNFHAKYTFYDLGYNARPTEIQGFLGNQQIGSWEEIVKKRQRNFLQFQKALSQNRQFVPLSLKHMQLVSNFDMPVICGTLATFIKYKNRLLKNGVEIRPVIAGDMSRQPFFKKYFRRIPQCPNAYFIHNFGFYFPNNAELTSREINTLCRLLKK